MSMGPSPKRLDLLAPRLVLAMLLLATTSPPAGARLFALAADDDRNAVGVRNGATGVAGKSGVKIGHASTLASSILAREFLAQVGPLCFSGPFDNLLRRGA